MPKVIAVDPGSLGYILEIDFIPSHSVTIKSSYRLDTHARLNPPDLYYWLSKRFTWGCLAIIEEPIPCVRGGGKSLLVQGANYGMVLGLLRCAAEHVHIVGPSTWQRALGLPGKDTKPKAKQIAVNLIGETPLIPSGASVPHAGIIDAFLIGYYGYLNFDLLKEEEK